MGKATSAASRKRRRARETVARRGKATTKATTRMKRATARKSAAKKTAQSTTKSRAKIAKPAAKTRKTAAGQTRAARKPRPVAEKKTTGKTRGRKAAASRKAAARATAARPLAKSQERRSHAVQKVLALKATKGEKAAVSNKGEFLIKAPKKAKQQNLLEPSRFVRRVIPPRREPVLPRAPVRGRKRVLGQKQLDEIRQMLQEERRRLIAQLAALDETASLKGPSDINEDIPGYSIHLAEYATDNQVVETSLAQRVLQAERLAEIEQAILRLGRPGYGICQNCGNPISLERLRVKPFAELCVPCRQLKEQGRL